MNNSPHILIVDDHREIRDAMSRYLQKNGMRTSTAASAVEMDAKLRTQAIDLIVLDIMMPGEDGLSACRRLRANSEMPVLMLTALADDTDRIVGLEIGADDYLTKPFNPRELLARVKAILRRTDTPTAVARSLGGEKLRFDRWTLDVDRQTLSDADGEIVTLTTAEFRLLVAFLERPRVVLSRDQLLDLTSGREAQIFDRSIDNQVSRLRRKIEVDSANPRIITTVWGGGYTLSTEVKTLS